MRAVGDGDRAARLIDDLLGNRHAEPGAGLGMAIAKEIVDQAGGTITIANRPQGGLEQVIRLPLAI